MRINEIEVDNNVIDQSPVAKIPASEETLVRSKYTKGQKVAAVEALALAKKLNEILKKVAEKQRNNPIK